MLDKRPRADRTYRDTLARFCATICATRITISACANLSHTPLSRIALASPPDALQPLDVPAIELLRIFQGRLVEWRTRISEWRQSHGRPALIEALGIFYFPNYEFAALIPIHVRGIQLWAAFIHSNSVLREVCPLRRQFTARRFLAKDLDHVPQELRLCNIVLHDHPRRLRRLLPDQRLSWPATLRNDLSQTRRIPSVHLFHSWMIALEQ